MSTIHTIAQVLAMPAGLPVTGFCGTILWVAERKPGKKEGFNQRIEVGDRDNKMQVWLFDCAEVTQGAKGKSITITSGKDAKGKVAGIETKEDDYDLKEGESPRIKCFVKGRFATLALEGQTRTQPPAKPATPAPQAAPDTSAQDKAADDAAQHQPSDEPPPTAKKPHPPKQTLAEAQEDVRTFKSNLMRLVNAYGLCIDAADWLCEQRGPSKALTPEHKQALVASLFIAADRSHWMHFMPGNQTVEQLMERKGQA